MGLTFYPSSWYYNAAMQEFLGVIALGLGNEIIEKRLLRDDGTVFLDDEIVQTILGVNGDESVVPIKEEKEVPAELPGLKRLAWWWVLSNVKPEKPDELPDAKSMLKEGTNCLVGNKGEYWNLLQRSWGQEEEFLNKWFSLDNSEGPQINCAFCGQPFGLDPTESRYYQYLTSTISSVISSSPAFPNMFFDGRPSTPICRQCRWPLVCYHLVRPRGLFINAGSFWLNWHLNRLFTNQQNYSDRYKQMVQALLGENRVRSTLGAWGQQGMEVIVYEGGSPKRYFLTRQLTGLLLNPGVAGLIKNINDARVLELVLSERFTEIPNSIYGRLRKALNESGQYERHQIEMITRLHCSILNHEARGESMNSTDLINCGRKAPFKIRDNQKRLNADLNLLFRLLELTRNNQRSQVYHLLLRKYMVEERIFPPVLSQVFLYEDQEMFKAGIFSYVAGITGQNEE